MTAPFERMLILFVAALVAGGFVFAFPRMVRPQLKFMLAFSGAFLLGIAVLHILPEAYSAGGVSVGMFVIVGFILQILLEYLSGGVEHGHIHGNVQAEEHRHAAISWTILASLVLHAFTESLPLGFSGHDHAGHVHDGYLWAIVIHKIPITIALVSLMVGMQTPKFRAVAFLVVFALAAPIGILVTPLFATAANPGPVFAAVMGIAGGIILHVSTTILLEASENHRFNIYKMIVILVGFSLAVLTH